MIYLDNNATTPILPEVVAAMMADLDGIPRNPSSVTTFGREARQKTVLARRKIADYFGVFPEEVIFTSGGTESNYLMIHGFYQRRPGHIITTRLEHASVLEPIRHLGKAIYVEVGELGAPTVQQIEKILQPNTSFILLSGANNETGVMVDLDGIAELAAYHEIPLLIDGVALLGKANFTLPPGVSAVSFSGHKIHGPKGIGLSIIRKKYKIQPLFRGGHQEHEMRAGTENLPAILGFAKAIELLTPDVPKKIQSIRDEFERKLGATVNGTGPRAANTSNLFFPDIDAENLLIRLDQQGVIASLGSACSAGTLEPSHVLLGMGYPKARALSSLRFSFSRLNTSQEIERALSILHSFHVIPL